MSKAQSYPALLRTMMKTNFSVRPVRCVLHTALPRFARAYEDLRAVEVIAPGYPLGGKVSDLPFIDMTMYGQTEWQKHLMFPSVTFENLGGVFLDLMATWVDAETEEMLYSIYMGMVDVQPPRVLVIPAVYLG